MNKINNMMVTEKVKNLLEGVKSNTVNDELVEEYSIGSIIIIDSKLVDNEILPARLLRLKIIKAFGDPCRGCIFSNKKSCKDLRYIIGQCNKYKRTDGVYIIFVEIPSVDMEEKSNNGLSEKANEVLLESIKTLLADTTNMRYFIDIECRKNSCKNTGTIIREVYQNALKGL